MKGIFLGALLGSLLVNSAPTERDTCKQIQHTFHLGAGNSTRADAVAQAYRRVFGEYEKYCFGKDGLQPLTMTCDADSLWGFGGTIIDGLDTAIIMNLPDIVEKGLNNTAHVDFS